MRFLETTILFALTCIVFVPAWLSMMDFLLVYDSLYACTNNNKINPVLSLLQVMSFAPNPIKSLLCMYVECTFLEPVLYCSMRRTVWSILAPLASEITTCFLLLEVAETPKYIRFLHIYYLFGENITTTICILDLWLWRAPSRQSHGSALFVSVAPL